MTRPPTRAASRSSFYKVVKRLSFIDDVNGQNLKCPVAHDLESSVGTSRTLMLAKGRQLSADRQWQYRREGNRAADRKLELDKEILAEGELEEPESKP